MHVLAARGPPQIPAPSLRTLPAVCGAWQAAASSAPFFAFQSRRPQRRGGGARAGPSYPQATHAGGRALGGMPPAMHAGAAAQGPAPCLRE